jgi:DNA-binding transcriptional LysR family regulator
MAMRAAWARRRRRSKIVWISRPACYDESVSLAQIRYFIAVAEEGHVGRAARGLRVAQPAVSRQIKNLEDELGARLFVRTPRGMRLSSSGEVFLDHARGIVAALDGALHAVRRGS